MDSKIIKGKSPLPNDNEILAALAKNADRTLGGNRMVIGVRNEALEIYRTVKTDGLPDFMAAIGVFNDFGMVDELEHLSDMRDGCDAIFSAAHDGTLTRLPKSSTTA